MLVASFLAGNIPLSFHLPEDRLKLFSNFGVGLLVGTSLVVIIPEGVETLYSAKPSPAPGAPGSGLNSPYSQPIKRSYQDSTASGTSLFRGTGRAAANVAGFVKRSEDVVVMRADHPYVVQDQFKQEEARPTSYEDNMIETRKANKFATFQNGFEDVSGPDHQDASALALEVGQRQSAIVKRQEGVDNPMDGIPGEDGENEDLPNGERDGDNHEGETETGAHKYIGLALLSGFILMFLIDQMGPTHAHSHNSQVSVADFTELHNLQLEDSNIRMPSAVGMGGGKKRGNPITIGLVVHAAADGIALGASATRPDLRFIVFLAIMLHKAPAAFGLSTVLLQHGFSRRQARQQLGIFSLAAPIGALLTYIFIQMSGQQDADSLQWWTGILLLFSGGTFLYVAMHVMSEMNNAESSSGSSGYVGGSGGEKGLSVVEVLCVIVGMVVPLILSVDHEH
ncbi:hypothetical protein BGZ98_010423 [Dissophora globulifera]|nr:hypothetical protein BGZ98_010423 [Dissophora globulifera]